MGGYTTSAAGAFGQEDWQRLRLFGGLLSVSQLLESYHISAVESLSVRAVGNTVVRSIAVKRTEGYSAGARSRFDMFHSGSVHV